MRGSITPVAVWPAMATVLSIGQTQITAYGDEGQAVVWWHLLAADDATLSWGQLTMGSDDYRAWGEDDTYLLAWAAGKLGLTLTPAT